VATYNTGLGRSGQYAGGAAGTLDPLISEPLVAGVIQELPQQSAVLAMANHTAMASKTQRQAVLDTLPQAYWLSGDADLKQTTTMAWKNVSLVAEELAVLVPIPDAYVADTSIDLWAEIRPRITEAFAKAIDAACLFGVNKPSTWSQAIVPGAIAAGNVGYNNGGDIPLNVAQLAELVSRDGYANVDGWASRPGFVWRLIQGRSSGSGEPIYRPNLEQGPGGATGSLYGYDLREVRNGAFDATQADLIIGDWSKAIIGLRQDMTFTMSDSAVIADATGKVIMSAFQSDSKILRCVMRLAFATANPVTALNGTGATRYPFGILAPGTSDS
jgi:HK97 family phage major capsid protein